jgi:hypothetical protein
LAALPLLGLEFADLALKTGLMTGAGLAFFAWIALAGLFTVAFCGAGL